MKIDGEEKHGPYINNHYHYFTILVQNKTMLEKKKRGEKGVSEDLHTNLNHLI